MGLEGASEAAADPGVAPWGNSLDQSQRRTTLVTMVLCHTHRPWRYQIIIKQHLNIDDAAQMLFLTHFGLPLRIELNY